MQGSSLGMKLKRSLVRAVEEYMNEDPKKKPHEARTVADVTFVFKDHGPLLRLVEERAEAKEAQALASADGGDVTVDSVNAANQKLNDYVTEHRATLTRPDEAWITVE
jgi:hypothetical protein